MKRGMWQSRAFPNVIDERVSYVKKVFTAATKLCKSIERSNKLDVG
jgi:hypothetical protein